MPFIGVLPERRSLFHPEPINPVAVSDAAAWSLNPRHRRVYDKLAIALDQQLPAAPCGVSPMDLGLAPEQRVFVKPITNLAGLSLGASSCRADQVEPTPGHFWCEYLSGAQTSSDCLVRDGRVLWTAHTLAADQRDQQRPIWWRVGVPLPRWEPFIADWVQAWLPDYTGLCNLEMIDGRVIEAHLRGSNNFFDLYGESFIAAWVTLVDHGDWRPPAPLPGGCVASLFGTGPMPAEAAEIAREYGVSITPDGYTADRIAIIRGRDAEAVLAALACMG